jgi:hypothetical protein
MTLAIDIFMIVLRIIVALSVLIWSLANRGGEYWRHPVFLVLMGVNVGLLLWRSRSPELSRR